MKAQDQRRWTDRPDGPRRFALLAAVALAHLGVIALLIALPQDQLRNVRDQTLRLITVRIPPPAPRRPHPAKPAPTKATSPPAKSSSTPAAKPPPPLPAPVPVSVPAVEAAADVGLATSVGSGPSGIGAATGSGGGGGGSGSGGGGGLARHAEWVGGGLTNRDYPEAAKRARLQGVVDVRFVVQIDGRVRECRIDHSSGSVELDRMTCGIVEQRLLYDPALDAAGKPVEEISGRRFRFVMVARAR